MTQITMDDLLDMSTENSPELICCSLSEGFHWLKITSGLTPSDFTKHIDFKLDGYDQLYINTSLKDEIVSVFDGQVKVVPYKPN